MRARIAAAAVAAGRQPSELTLIGVTKFFPAADAAILADLGVTDLGESRDQEAAAKIVQVASLRTGGPRWHFIGRLQTNKARSVVSYADVVHSVDRRALVDALAAAVQTIRRPALQVLIQVSLDGNAERGGAPSALLSQLAAQIATQPGLRLSGVMAVAPMTSEPDAAFAELADLAGRLRQEYPSAMIVSAGMSGDLEAAIGNGATHLRIGTALLGRRSATFG